MSKHGLGRVYVPDKNDWSIHKLLTEAGTEPHPAALMIGLARLPKQPDAALLNKTIQQVLDERTFFETWPAYRDLWSWIKAHRPKAPVPSPVPSTDVPAWPDAIQLDQGNTGHCVGFGWAGWGDSLPVADKFQNADGHKIYYEAKVIDGEPGQEDGSTVRSGAKAMQNRKRLTNYAFTNQIDEIVAWLNTKGPVVVGTDWYNGMFTPDHNNVIKPTGGVAGGHCYRLDDTTTHAGVESFLIGNSWGGECNSYISHDDFKRLLDAQGEACVALELALTE